MSLNERADIDERGRPSKSRRDIAAKSRVNSRAPAPDTNDTRVYQLNYFQAATATHEGGARRSVLQGRKSRPILFPLVHLSARVPLPSLPFPRDTRLSPRLRPCLPPAAGMHKRVTRETASRARGVYFDDLALHFRLIIVVNVSLSRIPSVEQIMYFCRRQLDLWEVLPLCRNDRGRRHEK